MNKYIEPPHGYYTIRVEDSHEDFVCVHLPIVYKVQVKQMREDLRGIDNWTHKAVCAAFPTDNTTMHRLARLVGLRFLDNSDDHSIYIYDGNHKEGATCPQH